MNHLNPEMQRQVEELAQLCCATLERSEGRADERLEPLVEALVAGGYARLSNINLQTRVEQQALASCGPVASHRRNELSGIARQMQQLFDERVKWQTSRPQPASGTQAANISSSTES